MTTTTQIDTPSFVMPPAAGLSLISDVTNAKTKVAAYLLAPAAGAPTLGSCNILKRKGTDAFAALVADQTEPLTLVLPTTATALTYRQAPNLGLARNLVTNGGTVNAHGMTLAAQAAVIADSTSPSGFSLRTIATAATQRSQWADQPVEAGMAYSAGMLMAGDGTNGATFTLQWLDASGGNISQPSSSAVTAAALTDTFLTNQIAPGNARTLRVLASNSAAGIFRHTCLRVMQQTTQVPAWTAAHQQFIQRGVSIYEASTNLAVDGDMEAVGTASYSAASSTLAKDATVVFAGSKSLKGTNTAANGYWSQGGALAPGQPVTASIRVKGGDAITMFQLYSTPSLTLLGGGNAVNPNTTDWNTLRRSGVIAVGDTGWGVYGTNGSGAAAVANWDNLAVENKAYDTMNADPNGLAFNVGARPASAVSLALPSTFDITDGTVLAVMRFDHAYDGEPTHARGLLNFVAGADSIGAYLEVNGNIVFFKARSGVIVGPSDAIATQPAAGDTVVIALRFSTTVGLKLFVSKNGGAVATYSSATPESLLPLGAPATALLLGAIFNDPNNYKNNATYGVIRIGKSGLTDTQISALVANPYQDPTDNDLAVWLFEGQGYQVPVVDDHLIKLGTSYDYRADINGTGASPATATGQVFSNTLAAAADSIWLKVPSDPTKNLKLRVKYEAGLQSKVPRRTTVLEPLSGPAKIVIQGPSAYGSEITLKLLYSGATGQDVIEAAFTALMNQTADVWLQDLFGGLRKVKFPEIAYQHLSLWMWVDLTLIEAA